jgi:transposase
MVRMQVKVLGAERRRRWSYDEKVRLVEETLHAGETVCGVARRHGLAPGLLFTWRRQAREGRLGGESVPGLVPVEIVSSPVLASTCAPQPPSLPPAQFASAGIIEIELGVACRVKVGRDVDTEVLQRVLELLRRR